MSPRPRKDPSVAPGLSRSDRSLMVKTIVLASLLLAVLLVGMHTLLAGLAPESPRWLSGVRTGAGLLLFWLMVTATVRALHEFAPRINPFWAAVTGVCTAAAGTLLFLVGLRLLALFWKSAAVLPAYETIWFYVLAGLFASLISLVNLRIENRAWNYGLQAILLLAGVILLFFLAR